VSEWQEVSLEAVAQINPTESLPKGTMAKKIAMDALQPFTKRPSSYEVEAYNGGMKFKNGDTIVARITPCLENGKTAYIDLLDDNEVAYGSTEYIVLREKLGVTEKQFLYYFSISPIFRDVAIASMTGSSGRQRVQTDVVKKHVFEMPSLEEQKAIASVLSSLDDKIDLLHRQNTTLERMAETLFRQWFVEEAQVDWDEVPLREVCLINNGYAFQSETYRETGQKIIRTMNFNNHWIEFNSLVYISEELARSFGKFYLRRNDFLLVMVGASLGNFAIVTDDVIPSLQNQNMWCFRSHENIFQHYLNFALRNIINDALNGASGSAREFFQKGVFYEIKIQTPPNELIQKFHNISESYFSKIELNRKQIKTLENLRDNLLPKLMSGEISVA
jgi:type I restriction enzyme S subunit